MNDFESLSSYYGFKPSDKSAPMAPPKSSNSTSFKTTSFPSSASSAFVDDPPNRHSDFSDLGNFDDIFPNSKSKSMNSNSNVSDSVDFDSIFGGGGGGGADSPPPPPPKFSSLPVFDKPVYDDDVSSSPIDHYDDIFASNKGSSSGGGGGGGGGGIGGDVFDDLLGGLGKKENLSAKSTVKGDVKVVSGFDDLLPGFGGSSAPINSSADAAKNARKVVEDPFDVLGSTLHRNASSSSGVSNDPFEEVVNSHRKKFENPSSGGVYEDIDPLNGFANPVPSESAEAYGREKDESPLRTGSRVSGRQTSPERGSERKIPVKEFGGSPHSVFEMPSFSADSSRSIPNASSPVFENRESYSHDHVSPTPEENIGLSDEVWLTVSEIPLFTQPTAAPPPSKPPPARPTQFSGAEYGSFPDSNAQREVDEYSSFPSSNPFFQSPKSAPAGGMSSFASPLDELEEFASGRHQSNVDENSHVHSSDDFDSNSVAAASAAAMKEAMDRAEAKFKYAKEIRDRENAKSSKSRESMQVEKEENTAQDAQDREFREGQERLMRVRQQRERGEEERRQREEDDQRRIQKEQEEKEREKRRVERERELARQAVERATKEARERAAIEARTRAERAAVQRAQAEARERAERAAVQRAQSEARERAAADAKERAEKAAAEAREKARSEAREKEAHERAAAAARASQQKNGPDLDSFFGMSSRASSAPKPRATSSDPFETQFQNKPAPEATRTSVNSTSNMRKASSSTSIADDLSSIFGAPSTSGDFQEVNGETDDRRRARLERHQRTQERAAKALADKNARDLEAQREQTERHRIGETLDVQIKRWAAGKEGNLRALLSTLQYVLWPECGWQPVSLTDLIVGAQVKKVYRKATLCIHPDKVQQKGATLQQKYVAEKVFDLLKEAWNKFNSEELF
ncbi:auxilin-related protein 1-like [Silene latifolia]|uniref:auxilin-related protein 1-like n=1 Tax=Silene latifolia TaxID=37657 RepID=UPI003D77DFC9